MSDSEFNQVQNDSAAAGYDAAMRESYTFATQSADVMSRILARKDARIAELETACSALVHQNAELEAENARLKAESEWHYLPELPKGVTDVLAAFDGAALPIQCWHNPRDGGWFTSEEAMHFAEGDFNNCEFRITPYAWRELPPMPPRP